MLKAPQLQNATDTINTLSSRLTSATLLEDKRAAILGLRSFAKGYPASVASGSLRDLITCLRDHGAGLGKDGEGDVDTVRSVLETLLMLFNPDRDSPEASEDIALWLADEFSQRQDNITILLDLLEVPDYYARIYSVQLLSSISSARPERTQQCILSAPLGTARLVGVLDDGREAVRDAALLLLVDLTSVSQTDLQKLIAFEDVFLRIFKLMDSEGGIAEGGIVIQDCLSLLANLIRHSSSNQSLFRETGCLPRLHDAIRQAGIWDQEENEFSRGNREKNVWGLLAVIRLFLERGELGTKTNQDAFWKAGIVQLVLDLAFNLSAAIPVRSSALRTCADMITSNPPIQESFASLLVATGPTSPLLTNGAAKKKEAQRAYVIEALLILMLGASPVDQIDLRFSASVLIKAYCLGHQRIRLHFLQRAIAGFVDGEDESTNILSTLMASPHGAAQTDPLRVVLAADILSQLLADDEEAKATLQAVSEGNAEKGEDVVTAVQTLSGHLTSSLQNDADPRISIAYLTLLTTAFFDSQLMINDCLAEGSSLLSVLIDTAAKCKDSQVTSDEVKSLLPGLCSFLLGSIYEFSTKDSPIPRRTLQPLLVNKLGRQRYFEALKQLRQHPFIRDSEISSQEGGMFGQGQVLFDPTFVELFKEEYGRLRRAIDKDPGIEVVSRGDGGVDRDILDELRDQLASKEEAIQQLEQGSLMLKQDSDQAAADHRKELQSLQASQRSMEAELDRIKKVNETLQREHEAEVSKLREDMSHEVERLQNHAKSATENAKIQHDREMDRLKGQHGASLASERSLWEDKIRRASDQGMQEAKKKVDELSGLLQQRDGELVVTKQDLKNVKVELDKVKDALETRIKSSQQADVELKKTKEMQGNLQQLNAKAMARVKSLEEEIKRAEARHADLSESREKITLERDELQSQLKELKDEVDGLKLELKTERKGYADLEAELEKAKTTPAAPIADDKKIEELEGEVEKQKKAVVDQTEEAKKARSELDDMLMVMADIEAKRDEYRDRLKRAGEHVSEDEDEDEADDDDDEEDEEDDEEERILAQWNEINAFHRQLELSTSRKPYTFYDGPPFATGTPHYGHLLASTIKDIIPRYWSMKGHHVERRFGWDTHGVPIEQIIDNQLQQELGVRGRAAVEKVGIAEYNRRCREVVLTYAGEWRRVIGRLGRWIDFDNDYKTMDCTFMESCWWVFKQLWEKELVYHGAKVLPYSTALNTPLSKSEAQEDYRDVQDPAVVVAFPLVDDPETSFLAWTTTPWTLPSNVGLCTHPEFEYLKIKDEESGKQYYLVEAGLKVLYKDPKKAKFKILEKTKGKDLLGKKYIPPFDYFYEEFKDVGFKMLNDEYVSDSEGVGIVHQSPAFGEDDYNIAWKAGVINESRAPPNPLDAGGNFVLPVKDFLGEHVKAADKNIMKYLEKAGKLVKKGQITHRYPHCPRSKTPLIQRAVPSWFIKVEGMVPQLLKNLEKTHWVPSGVKDGRFYNWLESARDWNVSRNRYWGTPIPLWVSDDFKEVVCVGSAAELKELTGYQGDITDLHRDKVDGLTIPSKQGKGTLRRIEEVFDCWFESGSMPYASQHYPFENKDNFFDKYPGDFIAEGLDQTRGWFYTMSVLGTALFDTFPYKNCVVNGIVLAEDGKKMSKSLKNYPDPNLVMDKYGSDPLRLYMINSPVVRAEPLRFKEDGVKQIVSSVILPLWNSYNFFDQQVTLLKKTENQDFKWDPAAEAKNTNVMDRWILASCQSLLAFVNTEMAAYRLYTVVPRLLGLIDNTTNWYIRFNRRRLKGEFGTSDTLHSLNTLFEVLYTLVRGLAPFTPFIADNIFLRLVPFIPTSHHEQDMRSVHFLSYPTVRTELDSPETERRVARMQRVIELGRLARDRRTISLKTPLKTLVVIHPSQEFLSDVKSLETYISDELNVRDVVLTSDDAKYNVKYTVQADFKSLGQKYKKDAMGIKKALPALTDAEIKGFIATGSITVQGKVLGVEDLRVSREVVKSPETKDLEAATEGETMVLLDCGVYEELQREGLARELVNRVQRLRKKVGLVPTDDVRVVLGVEKGEGAEVEGVVREYEGMFGKAGREVVCGADKGEGQVVAEEEAEVRELVVRVRLVKI
ncbi:hypothetical protein KVT40_002576 [Elsinoe batatas]|uniref:Isoleucine--tRNA ligase, cytoplasmic n=1 Tax=Elsinoe batatas TaxID=2601811 RepID=A0A8K0PG90_9PEZI|nr:hypothetical protein KVT40_002576 [Elsinoe batatas]